MSDREFTFGSLFSGFGGLDLGFEQAGMSCKWQVEINEYARAVLKKHWPNIPKYNDVCEFPPPEGDFNVDLVCGGFPCFPAGTLIETEFGHKPIEDIIVGERVLTHKNRIRRVVETMARTTQEIIRIRAFGSLPFETTDEHPFYVRKRVYVRKGKYRNPSPEFLPPEWVPAKQLTTEHFLAQPLFRPSCTRKWESKDFWYLIGRWLGDGWIVHHQRKSKIPPGKRGSRINSWTWKVVICGAIGENAEIAERIRRAGFHSCSAIERTVVKRIINSKELMKFVSQFGRGAGNKFIPEWVFGAPRHILMALLSGLCDSDGHINKRNGGTEFNSISKRLALNVSRLMRLVYDKPIGFHRGNKAGTAIIEGRTVNIKDSYSLRMSPMRTIGFSDGQHVWVPIRKIVRQYAQVNVYNIGVEEDESYVASSYVVHNCKQVSNARTAQVPVPEGLKGKDSGLWFQFSRIIRHLRPRWVVVENVGSLSTRGLETVLWELSSEGYDCEWSCLSAAALGAPHLRKRLFIVAVQDAHKQGLEGHVGRILAQPNGWRQHAHATRSNWGDSAPRFCGGASGIPPRMVDAKQRLIGLGNAVVPKIGQFIGQRIMEAEAHASSRS